jgi:DNA topoisomerase VI subunit A
MYGSKNLAQEHGSNIPETRWIGVKAEDLLVSSLLEEGVSMRLSRRDRMAAISMIASPEWRDESGDVLPSLVEPLAELRRMLMLNRKAEMQCLDEMPGGLEDWVVAKMEQRLSVC